MSETSPCPVQGCGGHRGRGMLMCRDCWRTVPRMLQRAVHASWKAYRRQIGAEKRLAAIKDYSVASDAAIAAVIEARP